MGHFSETARGRAEEISFSVRVLFDFHFGGTSFKLWK